MATVKDSKKSVACKTCGEKGRPSSFPEYRGGDCGACFRKRKEYEKSELFAKPCKVCGKAIGSSDRRKVVCSRACAFQNLRKDRIEVKCCNCGKSVLRYESSLKIRSAFACSNECQKIWAGTQGAGRLAKVGSKKWLANSDRARKEWRRKQSKDRRDKNDWIIAVSGKSKGQHREDRDSWEYRVGLRLGESSRRRNRKIITPRHSRTIQQAIRRLRNKRKYFELTDWHKAASNKLSSHTARRSRKDEARRKQGIKDWNGRWEDPKEWIQMRFEWVGN